MGKSRAIIGYLLLQVMVALPSAFGQFVVTNSGIPVVPYSTIGGPVYVTTNLQPSATYVAQYGVPLSTTYPTLPPCCCTAVPLVRSEQPAASHSVLRQSEREQAAGLVHQSAPRAGNGLNVTSPPSGDAQSAGTWRNGFPLELIVYYDGVPQSFGISGQPVTGKLFEVHSTLQAPQEKQRVTFGLGNPGNRQLAAVLTINGVSTAHEEIGDPEQMHKWVISPARRHLLQGYYQTDNKSFLTIEGMSVEESRKRFESFGGTNAAGWIRLYVYEIKREADSPELSRLSPAIQRDERSPIRANNPTRRAFRQVSSGGLMAWGTGEGDTDVRLATADAVTHIASLSLHYYLP